MKYNTGLFENEWYIMQILWDRSSASLRELCDALKDSKGWTKRFSKKPSQLWTGYIRGIFFLMVSNAVKEQKLSKTEFEELKKMLDSME